MNFLVAGIVGLLAFGIGVLSCWVVPYLSDTTKQNSDCGAEEPAVPVTSVSLFKKDNWRRWAAVIVASLLSAGAMCMAMRSQILLLDTVKLAVVLLMLLSAMFIDYDTHRIPNLLVLIALGCGTVFLILEFFMEPETFTSILISRIVGLLCCLVIFYLSSRLTKDGLGMGDVKLIAAIGWILGLTIALKTVLLSLFLCTAAALYLLLGKKKNKKDSIAFGPFLFFGYILMLILSGI